MLVAILKGGKTKIKSARKNLIKLPDEEGMV